jgi:hypothetical protein
VSTGEIVKDAELLAELKPLWRAHGCAFCARSVAPEGVQEGFDVELAHVMGRGMGGGRRRDVADNILGLCGEMADNKCHWRYDRHDIGIYTNTAGDEWWEIKTGRPLIVGGREQRNGPVRRLRLGVNVPQRANDPPRSPGALLRGASTAIPEGLAVAAPSALPAVRIDPTVEYTATNGRVDTPAARLEIIRQLVRVAERNRIAAALLLLKAWDDREYESLEKSWPEYYSECGIGKSEASKMLTVARTFRGQLMSLQQADADELSLERAYLAARLVREEVMGHTDALAAAVSTPSSGLVALLKGDEPADRCVCPGCGNNHVRRVEGGDE